MTPEAADLILAKFEGWTQKSVGIFFVWYDEKGNQRNYLPEYHKDLNLMVPIFKKLGDYDSGDFFCEKMEDGNYRFTVQYFNGSYIENAIIQTVTIQEAAAISAARAIETIEKNDH